MADVRPVRVPDNVKDEQALFLSDIFPTGYMAAENAQIKDGETVAIWGCGPVGQFAIRSALLMGAGRVVAIDEVSERLAMAEAGGEAVGEEAFRARSIHIEPKHVRAADSPRCARMAFPCRAGARTVPLKSAPGACLSDWAASSSAGSRRA